MELPPGRGRTAWPPRLTNRRTASSISPNRVRRIARSHSTRHDSLFDESCRGQCLARSQSRRVSRRLLMSDPPTTPTIVCDHSSAPGNSKPAVRPAARKRRWRRSTTDPLAGSCRLPAAPRRTHRGMGRCGMVLIESEICRQRGLPAVAVRVAVVDPLPMFRHGVTAILAADGHAVDTPDDLVAWASRRGSALVLLTRTRDADWRLLTRLREVRRTGSGPARLPHPRGDRRPSGPPRRHRQPRRNGLRRPASPTAFPACARSLTGLVRAAGATCSSPA